MAKRVRKPFGPLDNPNFCDRLWESGIYLGDNNDYTRLAATPVKRLLKFRGVGSKAVQNIAAFLEKHGHIKSAQDWLNGDCPEVNEKNPALWTLVSYERAFLKVLLPNGAWLEEIKTNMVWGGIDPVRATLERLLERGFVEVNSERLCKITDAAKSILKVDELEHEQFPYKVFEVVMKRKTRP